LERSSQERVHDLDARVDEIVNKRGRHDEAPAWWVARDIGVYQISHSVSVDSDSMGTKNPFSGHARSQSTTPSCIGGVRRVSRYSPRSRRSTVILPRLDAVPFAELSGQDDLALRGNICFHPTGKMVSAGAPVKLHRAFMPTRCNAISMH
jgi:hypothetical protein